MSIMSNIEPAARWKAITPSDSADVEVINGRYPYSLYVGGAGNVRIVNAHGDDEVFETVAAGSTIPAKGVKRVYATDTSATGIIGLY